LLEFSELASDLETMRSNLVGINERLQQEINDHQAAQAQRGVLEDQLRHSQRLESIGTFAGGVAHEVNNILLPMIIFTDIVLEDLPQDSPVRDYVQRIRRLANRAQGLSEQILTFSHEGAERELELAEIGPVVEEALTLVRALVPATIDIRTKIDGDCGKVMCNTTQLQQLVVNLCSNAYKAVAKGGNYIGVDLDAFQADQEFTSEHPQLNPGNYVRLSVSDDGIGMDTPIKERIFEPFFTGGRIGEGTGLGLAVVHGIATEHGGEIVVDSEPGVGSILHIYFPVAKTRIMS